MTIQINTLLSLNTPTILTQFPQHFPAHLRLWEILLNQHYGYENAQTLAQNYPDYETGNLALLQALIDSNNLYIYHPETGEILWQLN